MKNLHLILLSSILFFSACNEYQQTTCVESDKFVMRGDTCLIVDGDTINKSKVTEPSYLFNLYLDKYSCCLSQVQSLYLDIRQIPQSSLSKLNQFQNLHSLTLKGYDTLPDEIGQLKELRYLVISNNSKKEVAIPTSIQNLKKLNTIRLSTTKFPINLLKVPNLESLHINVTDSAFFPKKMTLLRNLKNLTIDYSPIFPLQITQITSLRSLDLSIFSSGKVTDSDNFTIPNDISKLTKLQSLNLSGHALDTLTRSIGELSQLQKLHLPYLKQAPSSLTNLQKLEHLYVSRSGNFLVKGIEDIIPKLKNLNTFKYLQQQFSDLLPLAKSIAQVKNLEVLDFTGEFNNLPDHFFQSNLTHLYLTNYPDGKQLEKLPRKILSLKRLTHLSITRTKIQRIPEEIDQLQKLESLILYDNQINYLPKTIEKLFNLVVLDLSKNPIKTISFDIKKLQRLKYYTFQNQSTP